MNIQNDLNEALLNTILNYEPIYNYWSIMSDGLDVETLASQLEDYFKQAIDSVPIMYKELLVVALVYADWKYIAKNLLDN